MAWVKCWFRCDIVGGMLFLCLRWQWIVLLRLGVALLSFVLVSWCVVCFWAPPLRPAVLLTRQLCGSGCVCRPEFSIIRLKNNSIYLKPDEILCLHWGKSFDLMTPANSVRRLEMQNFGFTTVFVPVLMSLAAESGRSRAESVHLLKPYLQWGKGSKSSKLCDSRRLRKKPQDAQDDVTELFDLFDAHFWGWKGIQNLDSQRRSSPVSTERNCRMGFVPLLEPSWRWG